MPLDTRFSPLAERPNFETSLDRTFPERVVLWAARARPEFPAPRAAAESARLSPCPCPCPSAKAEFPASSRPSETEIHKLRAKVISRAPSRKRTVTTHHQYRTSRTAN